MTAPICPYCKTESKMVTGTDVYPSRPDLSDKKFYMCKPCQAWVGVHIATNKPLGTLARASLRTMRLRAHNKLDLLWKNKYLKRGKVYALLAFYLNVIPKYCHIGMMSEKQCLDTIIWAKVKLKDFGYEPDAETNNETIQKDFPYSPGITSLFDDK